MAIWDASVDRSWILGLLFSAKRKQIQGSSLGMGAFAVLVEKGSLWMAWTGKWFVVR